MTEEDQQAGERACSQCRKVFPEEELLSFEGNELCAACKPHFFQRLRETGVSEQSAGTGGTTLVQVLIQRTRERLRGQRIAVLGPLFLGGFFSGVVLLGILISAMIVGSEWVFVVLFGISALCLVGPMLVGLCRCFLRISRAEGGALFVIFSGFSNFERNLKISLWGALLVGVYGLVCLVALESLSELSIFGDVAALILGLLASVVMVVGSLLYAYPILMAVLVAVDAPEKPALTCLQDGRRLIRGKGLKLLGMHIRQGFVLVIPLVLILLVSPGPLIPYAASAFVFLGLCPLALVIACFVVPTLVIGSCLFYEDLAEPERG